MRFPKVPGASIDHKFFLVNSFLEKRLGWRDRDLLLVSFSEAIL